VRHIADDVTRRCSARATQGLRALSLIFMLAAAGGCASFYELEKTPEGITDGVRPGDTVRVTTEDLGRVRVLVMAINDYELRGRINGNADDVVMLRYDHIDTIEVQHLNMRKALLSVVLPVVVGAIVVCNNTECRTDGSIDSVR
jgi:hypothetical protein